MILAHHHPIKHAGYLRRSLLIRSRPAGLWPMEALYVVGCVWLVSRHHAQPLPTT
jgi:hypothetical protein